MNPSRLQVEAIAAELARALGSAVHLRVNDLIESVDARYVLTTEEYLNLRDICEPIAKEMFARAMIEMWGVK